MKRVGPLESFPLLGFKDGRRIQGTYVRRPRKRLYLCRVRLVATSPLTGKTFAASHPQRIKEVNTRFKRIDLLEAENA